MKSAARNPKGHPSTGKMPAQTQAQPAPPRRAGLPRPELLGTIGFFVLYFLCLWVWIDVALIYHGSGQVQDFPSFYWTWEFARDFFRHPGGLVEYGSALLAQAMYSSCLGALVLTAQAALMFGGALACLRACGAKALRPLALVAPLLVLGIYSRYRHYSAPVTSFALGLVCVWIWLRLSRVHAVGAGVEPHLTKPQQRDENFDRLESSAAREFKPKARAHPAPLPREREKLSMVPWEKAERPSSSGIWWRLAGALLLLALLYPSAPSSLLVLVPLVLLCEVRARTAWFKLLLWLALSGIVPWIEGAALFGYATGEAYAKVLPLPWDPIVPKFAGVSFVIALYALPVLFCFGAWVWQISGLGTATTRPERDRSPAAAPTKSAGGPLRAGTARAPQAVSKRAVIQGIWWQSAATALLPLSVVWLVLNPRLRVVMRVDYLAWNGRWAEVLKAAQGNPRSPFVACTAAQASYHVGTLAERLPLLASPADLLLFEDKEHSHWKKSDLYFDLGYVNMALHHLTESMEFYGERPVLLRRLALVNLALTNVSTARVYLGTLTRAPFQGGWARGYLELLKIDPTLAGDAEVGRLRRLMIRQDSVVALSPDQELLALLAANRQNRMAFEYLMTYYLLAKNLNGFVKNLPRVNDFPGFKITPMWDEALILASRLAGRNIGVPGHTLAPEATTRVESVTRVLQQFKDNPDAARKQLMTEYGNSYTFYWWFHE